MVRLLGRFCTFAAFAAILINGCGESKDNSGPAKVDAKGEEGVELCQDAKDNDGDEMIDCADPGCAILTVCAKGSDGGLGAPGTEETLAACQDGKDNDSDGAIDCADTGCSGLVICVGNDAGVGTCNCDDGLTCTADTCNSTTKVCGHTVKAGSCVIAGRCYLDGAKNGSECQVCDAAASPAAWTPIVGGCTITGSCFKKGEKSPDGCSICDPSRSATAWSPVTTLGCTVAGRCYADGEKEASGCEVCNPALSTTALQPAPAACTIQGQCYAEAEKHPNLACSNVACNSIVSTTAWTVLGDECLIGNECYPANEKRSDGCAACVPSQSKTSWTSSTFACNVGGSCYAEAEKHPSPTCTTAVCEAATSSSAWTLKGSSECLIANRCYQAGDKTSNGCQECIPILSKTSWSSVPGGCNISGSCYAQNSAHPSPTCKTTTCNTSVSSSAWTVGGNECLINNVCYAAGDKAPGSCQECIPSVSKTAFTPSPTSCVIGGSCYSNGTAHPSATCNGLGVTCNSSLSTTQWSITGTTGCVIGNQCYANGALDPTGCAKCDTAVSKTSWTPQAQCTQIIMAALNGAHSGNLGGLAGANSLCSTQAAAAGYGGVWKAFLSTSSQNVINLITGTNATTLPVVNLQGSPLYSSWNAMFNMSSTTTWNSSYYLYAFSGKPVTSGNATPPTPNWLDADGWHGSLTSGLVSSGSTCSDWTNGTSGTGANGEWDLRYLFYVENNSCVNTLAVACVRIP